MLAEIYMKENGPKSSDMELERLFTKTKELIMVSGLRIDDIGAEKCKKEYLINKNEY